LSIDYSWDDGGILGSFTFTCFCGFLNNDGRSRDTYDLEEPRTLVCKKCGAKYKVRRRTWLEKVDE
jgi:transcription elongation factor Elf1